VLDLQQRFIWADAPTLAIKYRSQYDRQFVRDTIYLAVAMAREAAQPYIGKSRRPQYIINMKKDIGRQYPSSFPMLSAMSSSMLFRPPMVTSRDVQRSD
jgi:hypothetical protein